MRILTRYILREVTSHALIGAAIFTFVLFTRDLGRILELVVRASAPLPSVAEIFFYTVPLALTYTIPMSVLVGILIGLSRLAADSEITAMRASGMGVWSFGRVLSIFVVAAGLLALANSFTSRRGRWLLSDVSRINSKARKSPSKCSRASSMKAFQRSCSTCRMCTRAQGAAVWKGVFLADISDAANPRITLAHEGILVPEGQDRLHLHLIDGATHETDPAQADHYQISTFQQTDIPIELALRGKQNGRTGSGRRSNHLGSTRSRAPRRSRVSALVSHRIPPPLRSAHGVSGAGHGRNSFGPFVEEKRQVRRIRAHDCPGLRLLLRFSDRSIAGAGRAKFGPAFGAWLANIVFFAAALFLLWQAERRPIALSAFRLPWKRTRSGIRSERSRRDRIRLARRDSANAFERASTRRRVFSASFPTLLDDYVLRDFFVYLGMILSAFLVLLLVFTLFELLGDILRNQTPFIVVAEYLLNVAPYLLYSVAPLIMLLAVLITFGLMNRSNEITAIKATGTSIYRIVTPVLVAAAILAAGLFFADQFYLPHTNKRQEALHNQIKGKPAQTYLRPDRRWIFGQHNDIYYYQFFDPDRDQFANLTVFQHRPRQFRHHAAHPRRPRPLGRQSESLDLSNKAGSARCDGAAIAGLPHLRRLHLSRTQRDAFVLQEGSEAVFRDEL